MVLINFATMVYYDPKYLAYKGGAAGPPQWMYFTYVDDLLLTHQIDMYLFSWAAGLFIYQSFDAIDG
jgi:ethanolaminephosphotransferase